MMAQLLKLPFTVLFIVLFLQTNAQTGDEQITWREAMHQEDAWYGSDEAIRIADNLLIYQHKTGGWPKNTNMAEVLTDDEINRIEKDKKNPAKSVGQPTIDNGATSNQLQYLARIIEQTDQKNFKHSFIRGIDYFLLSQYENGGWPQYYPIRKGYYEHITFNDGAMMRTMYMLRSIAQGKYEFVDNKRVALAQKAIDKGIEVILQTQISVDDHLTAWCAQYNQETLEPANARAYELISISGAESVGIVKYLMEIDQPNESVVLAVKSAITWLEKVKITGVRLIKKPDESLPKGYDLLVGFDPESTSPLWARFYEIGTNYPMFIDRDGVMNYALSEIQYERRVGYKWLGDWAENLIAEDYPKWCEKWRISID